MYANGRNTEDSRADVTKVRGAFRDCAKDPYAWRDGLRRMN